MSAHATVTQLKQFRERRGLAAAELAKAAGVSRQTIYAIEDGTYVPNTAVALRLARALDARVEELFRLDDHAGDATFPTRATLLEDWRESNGRLVRLGRVGEHVVAVPQPARLSYLPRATGRVNDPSASREAGQKISVETYAEGPEKQLVIAGCDPALSILEQLLIPLGVEIVTVPCSSRQALHWLRQGLVHIAGSHLVDRKSGEYNLTALRRVFPSEAMHVAGFARWEQGLLAARGNPKSVKSVADLARAGISVVNRDKGSGSRQLLDAALQSAGIKGETVTGYQRMASGHLAAARRVAAGKADCCIASRAAAAVYGLEFMALQEEQFELCFNGATMMLPATRVMLDVLNGAALRAGLNNFAGYDTSNTGTLRQS